MDSQKVRNQIDQFLAGKYNKPIDDFCLYQWLERCSYHEWIDIGLHLSKHIDLSKYEKPLQERIQFLLKGLNGKWVEFEKKSPLEKYLLTQNNNNRRRRGVITTNAEYRPYIIQVLKEFGGSAKVKVVAREIEHRMKSIFKEADYNIRESDKHPVWYNSMCWERQKMVEDGLLKKISPWGTWELTE